MQISPTQADVQAALTAFLAAVLPGLPGSAPAVFVGVIAGTTLTASGVPGLQPAGVQGQILPNAPLLGLGVSPGTTIVRQLTGQTGAAGTYEVSESQTVGDSESNVTMSTGVSVVVGQTNRVAEPTNPYFAVFVLGAFPRLATNVDSSADCKFSGALGDGTMTVESVDIGAVAVGATVFGTGVTAGTTVLAQETGEPGGAGTYSVTGTQVLAQQTLSAGQTVLTQEAEVDAQIDLHSPDSLAGDFAQTVSTTMRDQFGTSFFAELEPPLDAVSPLHADDPRQTPFQNAESQWEWRWTVTAKLQVNQSVSVPQQYADEAAVEPRDVGALYPPS